MNKRVMTQEGGSEYFALIICGALFICGCIAGTACARYAALDVLSDFLTRYLTLAGNPQSFLPALWNMCKYHLAAVFFGFSVIGVLCIPALSAARGFFLCFSISAFVRCFGGDGVFLALAIFGVSALVALPCFFVLCSQSFYASICLLKNSAPGGIRVPYRPYGDGFFRRLALCSFTLVCSALVDSLLLARLVAALAARLS